MTSLFSEAYADIRAGLASKKFSSDKEWQAFVTRARKFADDEGFEVGEASLVEDLRKHLKKADAKGTNEAVSLLAGAGEQLSGTGAGATVDGDLAQRLGALKTLRHTYLLKRFGAHKVWCLSIPASFTDWPCEALKGGIAGVTTKLIDQTERFTAEQRKHLSHASQEGLKWVHKAMSVASSPKNKKNFELIARWFADANRKEADVVAAAATLNAGLKKLAAKLKSGRLIYTDSVSERGTNANDGTEAFVWGDPLDVVYIEQEFFGTQNTLSGLTNWARIVVHELTHRELNTKDHAYEHQGINPCTLGAGKAIENADSWAWFCADCAGALTDGIIKNALAR
jgi:plasmid stabilization system protein ParE